jgi:acetyl-CoA C-acetyltransferase
MGSGRLTDQTTEVVRTTPTVAQRAYELAGVAVEDVSLVELHDAFAIGELLYIEDLGLATRGTAWSELGEGAFDLDGRVAVNPGGGLLGRGHPMGPTGLAQICEVTWQLRNEAAGRQVQNARVGVTHTMGGNQLDLECNACVVNILVR